MERASWVYGSSDKGESIHRRPDNDECGDDDSDRRAEYPEIVDEGDKEGKREKQKAWESFDDGPETPGFRAVELLCPS